MSGTGGSGQPVGPGYPGQRLGLPETGPGSVASWGRRVGALLLDWFASSFVAYVIVNATGSSLVQEWVTLLVFFVEVTLFTALVGGSFGQLAFRVGIVRLDGRPLTIIDAMIRTLLICLVIPPVVFNPDRRGIHDLVVKSVALQR
jgi:uncharacterized RDD family membrane protein YckC